MHCFIVSIAKLTSIPQEVVDFTKKQKERKEKERHRKKQHIRNNIKSAGEPICKTKWHHSPFLYAIKRVLKRHAVTMENTNGYIFLKFPIDTYCYDR